MQRLSQQSTSSIGELAQVALARGGGPILAFLCILAAARLVCGDEIVSEPAPAIQPTETVAEGNAVGRGTVEFRPSRAEADLPKQFQLGPHQFDFTLTPIETASQTFRIWQLTFPSPVVTAEVNNNTVHCEYFCPLTPGPRPGVIVLHILGGDFELARLFCRSLAQQGVSALFVKMPYYGPRRTPGSPNRMVSFDPESTVRGMTQAVLDIRQAVAWLAAREEVDPGRLGIMGISLGGITSALAAAAEPRLQNICLILAGGDIGQVAWDSRHLAPLRKRWAAQGGTRESLVELLTPVDPVTYGQNVPRPANSDAQRRTGRSDSTGLHRVAVAGDRQTGNHLVERHPLHRYPVPVRRNGPGDPLLPRFAPAARRPARAQ